MSTQWSGGMAVEVDGAGDAIVLVHGLGGTSNTFTPQVLAFEGRCRTIRPDLVGSGRSPLAGTLSINRFMDDLLAMMRELGVASAHLVGHSLGTIVCQHLALRAPAQVRSLVLLGPIGAPPDAGRAGLRERARKARAEGMAEIADAIVQGSMAKASRADLPVAAAAVRESLMRQPPEGYAATCEALAEATAADVSGIRCPALLITGEEDGVATPQTARGLADGISGARLVLLPRCGHWSTFERAGEVNREIRHFYAALR